MKRCFFVLYNRSKLKIVVNFIYISVTNKILIHLVGMCCFAFDAKSRGEKIGRGNNAIPLTTSSTV